MKKEEYRDYDELDSLKLYPAANPNRKDPWSLEACVLQEKIQSLKTEANTLRRLAKQADKAAEQLQKSFEEEMRRNDN